jgi:hypothetical protein
MLYSSQLNEQCFDCTGAAFFLKGVISSVCEALIDAKDDLNELDRGSGDGDCGSTLAVGALGEFFSIRFFHNEHVILQPFRSR